MSRSGTWHAANRRYLAAALGQLRLLLETWLDDSVAAPNEQQDEHAASMRRDLAAAEAAMPSPAALVELAGLLDLSIFERWLVLLCAAAELDGDFARLLAAHEQTRAGITFGLALAVLPEPHWEALAPEGSLRFWHVLEIGPGAALTASPLRLDERILHYLTGVDAVDERLPLWTHVPDGDALAAAADHATAASLARAWTLDDVPVAQLAGRDRRHRVALARAACAQLGLELSVLSASSLPAAARDLRELTRLWNREALLGDRVLLIEHDGQGGDPGTERTDERTLTRALEELYAPVVVGTPQRISLGDAPMLLFEAAEPDDASQQALWQAALAGRYPPLAEAVERIVAQFRLGAPVIAAAAAALGEPASPVDAERALWAFCRGQARSRLDTLAQRVRSVAMWDDLVLPGPQAAMLREVAAQVRHRAQVYGHWGFAAGGSRGLGITALFAGPSGTGKTLAAEVLAAELELDLYRIDLSAVVSKYIGETEKSLRRVFDAAEEGGAILLFDEADALFGKRSEVKDSHDRHANVEVSYLLQRMEAYRGLAILTTNLKPALDVAFLRRLRFVVDFPFPGVAERAAIWARGIPAAVPTEGIDLGKLARLNMAGGNIRNVCLSAAFAAAADGGVLGMRHFLQAARAESFKLDRALSEAETRDWLEPNAPQAARRSVEPAVASLEPAR